MVFAGQIPLSAVRGLQRFSARPRLNKARGPVSDLILRGPCFPHQRFYNALQVEGKAESLLIRGSLVAYAVVYPTGERRLALEVGEVRWWLLTDTASLKVAPSTYMMSLPGGKVFHSITFSVETPPEVSRSPRPALTSRGLDRTTSAVTPSTRPCASVVNGVLYSLTEAIHFTRTNTASEYVPLSNIADQMFQSGGQFRQHNLESCAAPVQAVGAFEALLQEVTMYRESEALLRDPELLQDPQLAQGDQAIAEGLQGLVFQNKLARGIHSVSMKVRQRPCIHSASAPY